MSQIADHSYLSLLLDCLRAFFYKHEELIEAKGDAIRLKAGSAMHKGLAVIHETWEIEPAVEAMRTELGTSSGVGDLDFLTSGHLEAVLRNYLDYWKDRDPFVVVEMIEEPIIQQLDGLWIGGIPDMVVEQEGELVVLDHKTTSSYLGSHLYNRVKFSKQFPIYCLLLTEKLGKPVRRGICNAIYTGKYATVEKSKASKFERYSFEYSEEDLEETVQWIREVQSIIKHFDSIHVNRWPQHGGSHCGWCEYKELCEVAPPLRDAIKARSFQKREISGKLLSGADR